MNCLVLSGTAPIVLSGTESSCYRGPKSAETPSISKASEARNFSNLESFGFLLTEPAKTPLSAREISRTGAAFREPGAGFAYRVHKPRARPPGETFNIRAFTSNAARFASSHLQHRSVHKLGTFRIRFTNQEPARFPQLVGKTRICAAADSRNQEHRHPPCGATASGPRQRSGCLDPLAVNETKRPSKRAATGTQDTLIGRAELIRHPLHNHDSLS